MNYGCFSCAATSFWVRRPKVVATERSTNSIGSGNPSLPSGMYWIDPDGQGVDDEVDVQIIVR